MHVIGTKNILNMKIRNTNFGKTRLRRLVVILGITLSQIWMLSSNVLAHEPIFGVGPRTIWNNGFGYEMGLEHEQSTAEGHWSMDYHAVYGLTEDWSLFAETHQALGSGAGFTEAFEDLNLRTKYRFFRHDVLGGVYHTAVMGGVVLPLGGSGHEGEDSDGSVGHSSKPTGVMAGFSAAYEGRRWMYWGTGRYRINSTPEAQVQPGNVLLYDLALGFRPVLTGFYDPDMVLIAELNGQVVGSKQSNGAQIQGSAGSRLRAGFGVWITYRNWALKPGIQLPIYNTHSGGDLNYRWVFTTELHL